MLAATSDETRDLAALVGAAPNACGELAFELPAHGLAGAIVITGMGPAPAARAASAAIERYSPDYVLNVGVCGAIAELEFGALCRVVEAADGDDPAARPLPCALLTPAWSHLTPVRLATVAEPVFDREARRKLARIADVVDMEGAAIAGVCRQRGLPCCLVKGVTDSAGDTGRQELHRNIAAVSAKLAKAVADGLQTVPPPQGAARSLAGLVKVEHTIFSLPLVLAGAYLGGGWPSWRLVTLVLLACAGARAFGMAANRVLDRRLDARNPRTAWRHLPSGRMRTWQAVVVALAGLALYLGAAAAISPLCLALAPAPAACLAGYSLLKRFTSLCHLGIGVCMGLAPLAAYVAASGTLEFPAAAWLLAAFAGLWISGFDITYSLLDAESDRACGVLSLPVALGPAAASAVAAGLHLLAAGAVTWLWLIVGGWWSLAAVALAVGGLVAGNLPGISPRTRFFPISALAGVAGALVPLLGART